MSETMSQRSFPKGLLVVWILVLLGLIFLVKQSRPITEVKTRRDKGFAGRTEKSLRQELSKIGIEEAWIRLETPSTGIDQLKIRVPNDLPLLACNLEVTRILRNGEGRVLRATRDAQRNIVAIFAGTGNRAGIRILLLPDRRISRRTGRIALIIDDFGGGNMEIAKKFCTLPQPITLAIFPGMETSQDIADLALQHGHEVIVHLPMEPHDPDKDPGGDAIFVKQSTETIRTLTRRLLRSLPQAVGVNNHMGSKATEDPRVMRVVLDEVKRQRKFFIDSRTSSSSVAYTLARRMGIRTAKLELFLDNEDDDDAVKKRLYELSDLATQDGKAIGIGHDRETTIEVLQEVLPQLERRGFRFVKASEIVE
ncbi:MAG: divergent polysaccharide deacetylase family protein [Candidatus Latescibacteria bacterium]|nr:divergent polysaccharide deacetylase family protein [Candidatus Latescibacterota bacterium]